MKNISDDYDYLGNSASASDCTGLQHRAPTNEYEKEAYDEVYHYLPPKINKKIPSATHKRKS